MSITFHYFSIRFLNLFSYLHQVDEIKAAASQRYRIDERCTCKGEETKAWAGW
jgi:hypothetical protein